MCYYVLEDVSTLFILSLIFAEHKNMSDLFHMQDWFDFCFLCYL